MEKARIAVVEDDKSASEDLCNFINRYGGENGQEFEISRFYTATLFISSFRNNFDIIFMDIELPDGNGMEVVKKVRETDENVLVIFVTNMKQYAVNGYEVRAFDFIIKPLSYYNFSLKFSDVMKCFRAKREIFVWISNKDGKMRLNASRIKYIEVFKHVLIYHTLDGIFQSSGSLNRLEETLRGANFAECNRCYLINLRYVTEVKQFSVVVGGEELQISRLKRSSFMRELNKFLAGSD